MKIYTGKRAQLLAPGRDPSGLLQEMSIDAGSIVVVERAANRTPGQWLVRDEQTNALALVSEGDLAPVEAQS